MSDQRPEFTLRSYLRDSMSYIILSFACAASIGAAVKVLGCPMQAALVLAATVLLFAAAALVVGYVRKRAFYREVQDTARQVEDAYYLPEFITRPRFLEGQILYDTANAVAKSDALLLSDERAAAAQSREFTELWTHEVKTPIAAARLTLSRMHGADALALKQEIEAIEVACERALYSSRTSSLSSDYMIRETPLQALCKNACKDLANLLVQSGVSPVFNLDAETCVLTDEQWTRFVIKQIISNSAKYQASSVAFTSREIDAETPHGHIDLVIADNGCGIAAEELPSIFKRGFSGSNGRAEGRSTGMGLYLAAEACRAMGVGLSAASTADKGTIMTLSFPLDRTGL